MIAAIVGHGASPTGRGWGAQIDSADAVIRMWDWFMFQGTADYGTRYDLGVIRMRPSEAERGWPPERLPARGWMFYAPDRRDPTWWIAQAQGAGREAHLIPDRRRDPGEPKITRGTTAAAWAMETLRPSHLILVGFDNVHAGEPTAAAPGNMALWPGDFKDGVWQHGGHAWATEHALLERIAAETHTRLVWPEDIWP